MNDYIIPPPSKSLPPLTVFVCSKCAAEWIPRVPSPKRCPVCLARRWWEAPDAQVEVQAEGQEKGQELTIEQVLPRIPTRTRGVRAHSYVRYFHNLKLLGWVEPTGEEEPSVPGGSPGARLERISEGTALVEVPQPRRFYRLTAKGRQATAQEWANPLVALYGYTPEQRRGKAVSPEA